MPELTESLNNSDFFEKLQENLTYQDYALSFSNCLEKYITIFLWAISRN